MKTRTKRELILTVSRASACALTALVLGSGVTLPWPAQAATIDSPETTREEGSRNGGTDRCLIGAWAAALQRKIQMA